MVDVTTLATRSVPLGRNLIAARRTIRLAAFGALGVAAALGASLFHGAAAKGEVVKVEVVVPAFSPPNIEMDLGARAWPRRIFAAETAAFGVRFRAAEDLALRVGLEGEVARPRLSIDGDDHAEDRIIRVGPSRRAAVAISFEIPADRLGRPVPAEAFLFVTEDGTGRPLGRIPLRVIDTRAGAVATPKDGAQHGRHDHSGH